MPAMIIGVDNRAIEIKKDINLNVIERTDSIKLKNWVQGKTNTGPLKLPLENINSWKNQFLKYHFY
jgi:hypothetical protein